MYFETARSPTGTDLDITFTLNGREVAVTIPTSRVLLSLLRGEFDLTGVRGSCERGVCGVCTVLLDDVPVAACSLFAFEVDGSRVETIEGQLVDGAPGPVQRAFVDCGGLQCGFCTPGMVMLTTGLLRKEPLPDRHLATEWISSNICRCTGYQMILDSVERAAQLCRDEGEIRG